jgi:exonuclease III
VGAARSALVGTPLGGHRCRTQPPTRGGPSQDVSHADGDDASGSDSEYGDGFVLVGERGGVDETEEQDETWSLPGDSGGGSVGTADVEDPSREEAAELAADPILARWGLDEEADALRAAYKVKKRRAERADKEPWLDDDIGRAERAAAAARRRRGARKARRVREQERGQDAGDEMPVAVKTWLDTASVRAARDGERARVCVWADQAVRVPDVARRVEWALVQQGTSLMEQVLSIDRVRGADSGRHDVWVRASAVRGVTRALESAAQKYGWTVRQHRSYQRRRVEKRLHAAAVGLPRPLGRTRARRATALVQQPAALTTVATLNVNGLNTPQRRAAVKKIVTEEDVCVLALQETLLKAEAGSRFSMAGYTVFAVAGANVEAERGLATVVRHGVKAEVYGRAHPCCLAMRMVGGSFGQPTVVVNMYLPGRAAARKGAVRAFKKVAEAIHKEKRATPVIIMGDWNCEKTAAVKLMETYLPQGRVVRTARHHKANDSSRTTGRRWIDHIAAVHAGAMVMSGAHLLSYRFSDHWPVAARVLVRERKDAEKGDGEAAAVAAAQEGRRFDLRHLSCPLPSQKNGAMATKARIATHNRWDVLAEEHDLPELDEYEGGDFRWGQRAADEGLNPLVDSFNQGAFEVGDDVGVMKATAGAATRSGALRRKSARRANAARAATREWRKAAPAARVRLKAAAREKTKAARTDITKEARRRFLEKVMTASRDKRFNVRQYWRFVQRYSKYRGASGATRGWQPIKDSTGRLQADQQGICDAWQQHYAGLIKDVTGHSKDVDFWRDKFPDDDEVVEMVDLNRPFVAEELAATLVKMKSNKAPGIDGVPVDLLKMATVAPRGGLMRVLCALVNMQYAAGVLANGFQCASIVSIPKKGDLTDPNNYRGIALMAAALKVLTSAFNARLVELCETRGIFCDAQAGFRHREECPTQVAALVEIVERRAAVGASTTALFVDLRKAYDTVPHEALMRKLELYGVRGRALGFLRTLYNNSYVRVRCGDAPYVYSPSARLDRGVRQGDPMSCTLFNLFFNDVVASSAERGAWVPHTDDRRHNSELSDWYLAPQGGAGQGDVDLGQVERAAAARDGERRVERAAPAPRVCWRMMIWQDQVRARTWRADDEWDDFETMAPGRLVGSFAVDDYLRLLQQQRDPRSERVVYISAAQSAGLAHGVELALDGVTDPRTRPGARWVLAPTHTGDNVNGHWHVMVFDRERQTATLWDSLNRPDEAAAWKAQLTMVEADAVTRARWRYVHSPGACPKQQDGVSCGIFSIALCRSVYEGAAPDMNLHYKVRAVRYHMAKELELQQLLIPRRMGQRLRQGCMWAVTWRRERVEAEVRDGVWATGDGPEVVAAATGADAPTETADAGGDSDPEDFIAVERVDTVTARAAVAESGRVVAESGRVVAARTGVSASTAQGEASSSDSDGGTSDSDTSDSETSEDDTSDDDDDWPRVVPKGEMLRIPDLLFADDLVSITGHREQTEKRLAELTAWLTDNEMEAGIMKCGLLLCHPTDDEKEELMDGTWGQGLELQNKQVPVVESYEYLGVKLDWMMTRAGMAKPRIEKGKKLINMVTPFLRNPVVPSAIKMQVIKGAVIPSMLYGAALFGMSVERMRAAQVALNKALRMAVGLKKTTMVSNVALWGEAGVFPLYALAAAEAARAIMKASTLKTPVARLVRTSDKGNGRTWVLQTKRWLRRHLYRDARQPAARRLGLTKASYKLIRAHPLAYQRGFQSEKDFGRAVRATTAARYERRYMGRTASRFYARAARTNRFRAGRLSRLVFAAFPALEPGLRIITKMRLGAYYTGGKLARRQLMDDEYLAMCPFCKEEVNEYKGGESVTHLLIDCRAWRVPRQRWINEAIDKCEHLAIEEMGRRRLQQRQRRGGNRAGDEGEDEDKDDAEDEDEGEDGDENKDKTTSKKNCIAPEGGVRTGWTGARASVSGGSAGHRRSVRRGEAVGRLTAALLLGGRAVRTRCLADGWDAIQEEDVLDPMSEGTEQGERAMCLAVAGFLREVHPRRMVLLERIRADEDVPSSQDQVQSRSSEEPGVPAGRGG